VRRSKSVARVRRGAASTGGTGSAPRSGARARGVLGDTARRPAPGIEALMRLAFAVALVITLGSTEIERAQQMARSREAERAQFHRRYLFDLPGDTVTQLEVITEFRRLVMITEDHLRLGDQ